MKLWARILNAVPRSRLALKNKPFACETAKAHFLGLLTSEGIEPWRVDLLPLAVANSDHLGQYCLMDISLDPFPYAGTTTTCESLYMGVPCITLAGAAAGAGVCRCWLGQVCAGSMEQLTMYTAGAGSGDAGQTLNPL